MESPRTGRVVSADSKDLQKRWLVLAATLGVAADEAMQWWDTIQSAYTEPTRSLGGRALRQRAPRAGAHMQPTSIPGTWGHAVGGDLNATKAREIP